MKILLIAIGLIAIFILTYIIINIQSEDKIEFGESKNV